MSDVVSVETLENLLEHCLQHFREMKEPFSDAALFHLAKISCQVESAKALVHQNSTHRKLIQFHIHNSLSLVRSKLSEFPQDFGFKSIAQIFDKNENQPPFSLPELVELGKSIASHGSVPELALDENHLMIKDTFRKFADTTVAPLAEKIHRQDLLIPEEIISQLKELGCFGLNIPESFGGFQSETDPDYLGMILVTEELSRGSLGAAGSLITRPEILARALLKGGTEAQKKLWLPKIASGEKMAAIAVTEPDYGSDVAGLKVTATPKTVGSLKGWILNGTKTWCTFAGRADVLAVLARSSPDMSLKHKGLSLFLVEKPRELGHSFHLNQNECGTIEARAIPTIGYRGMHSFEVKFENWFVPDSHLVGGEAGLGKGFYFQMEGFAAGRLQTAARANGLMHAALEKAISYANERKIFGKSIAEQPASSIKLAQMSSALLASRALTYHASKNLEKPNGILLAAMSKLYASQTAEWLTREAQQLHGGMGYAEEFAVSRYFVDARVLSIFEGAEEVLAVKVIAPALIGKKDL